MKRVRKQHILEEHYLDFYCRAVKILDNEDDAKDAVQEAVVKTLVRLGVKDPVGYCYRTTMHECVNILRRRQRLTELTEQMHPTDYREERIVQVVNEGKEQLQPMERLVLEFHREDGYTLPKLSALIGVSVSTVKRILASADQKMRKTITDTL